MNNHTTARKIIFLLPVWGGGGGEKVISDLSLNLPDTIEKIIVPFENKNYYPYKGKMISLDLPLSTNPMMKFFIFIQGYRKFKKILSRERPDYVISFGSLQNIINILASKKSIVRIDNPIAISHTRFLEKLYPIFVRLFFHKAHKIIVVSQGLKEELVNTFKVQPDHIDVIYNSVDIKNVQELAKEPLELQYEELFSHPVIINIGSLIGQKGQAHLIQGFSQAKKDIPDLKLLILGEGTLEHHLKRMVEHLGLENDVYFLGWQKNPFKFLARSRALVLSSLWEGFGIVMLEAMACRVPIISSDCDFGPREILDSSDGVHARVKTIEYKPYGVLYPILQTSSLAEAIGTVLGDSVLRKNIVERAAQRVQDFNVKNVLTQYEFLRSEARKINWIFIDRRAGGGFVYNTEAREVLTRDFDLENVVIEDNYLGFRYFKPFVWFWQILRSRIDGDILIEESFDTLIFPLFRKNIQKVALIHHIDNSSLSIFFYPIMFLAEKLFYKNVRNFNAVVVVSEYWKQHFLNKGCRNVTKIYNSFDLDDFSILPERIQDFKERHKLVGKPIVYIGNCHKSKGVIESYEALKDLDVFLVTSGERRVSIPAINLNLNYQDYLCLLKSSSVVVTMSKFKEGWCRTAHEAMLLKTPVIGSGVGGMQELLEGGKQIVCKDFASLKGQVEHLLQSEKTRDEMGNNGFAYAQKFTKETFVQGWLSLIDSLSHPKL